MLEPALLLHPPLYRHALGVVVTPYRTAVWDGAALTFGPGGQRAEVPAEDALDEDWRVYYASVFNPARLNPRLMRGHMPKKYWRNMPESRDIPALVAAAAPRAEAMLAAEPTEPPARAGWSCSLMPSTAPAGSLAPSHQPRSRPRGAAAAPARYGSPRPRPCLAKARGLRP